MSKRDEDTINRGWRRSPRSEPNIARQVLDLVIECGQPDNRKLWELFVATDNELYLRKGDDSEFAPTPLQRQIWANRKKTMNGQEQIILKRLNIIKDIFSKNTQSRITSYIKKNECFSKKAE